MSLPHGSSYCVVVASLSYCNAVELTIKCGDSNGGSIYPCIVYC